LPFPSTTVLLPVLNSWLQAIEKTGVWAPWIFLGIFFAASALIIWRLEAMGTGGFQGTVLGTLIMPYCSGIGNLALAFKLGMDNGPGAEVMTSSMVNNATNLTLLIGLPAIFWQLTVMPEGKAKPRKRGALVEQKINRLSLLLTLLAVLFFSGATWALAQDGKLTFNDGLVLIGLFLFWQCFHVFDVMKSNLRQNKSLGWMLPFDLLLLAIGAFATFVSINWLTDWILPREGGFISKDNLGLLSGWLLVIPNALLALYYGWRGNPEVVYTSQVGDGHICIPLCIGIIALYQPITAPESFQTGMLVLGAVALVHIACVTIFAGLPRLMGWLLLLAYGVFVWKVLLHR
jgi:cation:H+ antiporter